MTIWNTIACDSSRPSNITPNVMLHAKMMMQLRAQTAIPVWPALECPHEHKVSPQLVQIPNAPQVLTAISVEIIVKACRASCSEVRQALSFQRPRVCLPDIGDDIYCPVILTSHKQQS